MKQVNKQNIHQKQSILCVICNTKIHHLKKSKFKVVFDSFFFLSFCYALCEYVFPFDKASSKSSPSSQKTVNC